MFLCDLMTVTTLQTSTFSIKNFVTHIHTLFCMHFSTTGAAHMKPECLKSCIEKRANIINFAKKNNETKQCGFDLLGSEKSASLWYFGID